VEPRTAAANPRVPRARSRASHRSHLALAGGVDGARPRGAAADRSEVAIGRTCTPFRRARLSEAFLLRDCRRLEKSEYHPKPVTRCDTRKVTGLITAERTSNTGGIQAFSNVDGLIITKKGGF
jgi:hypothetical protein